VNNTFKLAKDSIDKDLKVKHPSENGETQMQALKEKYLGLASQYLGEILNGVDNSSNILNFTEIIEKKTALKNCNTNTTNNFLNDIERAFMNNCALIGQECNVPDPTKISVNRYFYYLELLKERAKS